VYTPALLASSTRVSPFLSLASLNSCAADLFVLITGVYYHVISQSVGLNVTVFLHVPRVYETIVELIVIMHLFFCMSPARGLLITMQIILYPCRAVRQTWLSWSDCHG
jgi:hypothetical protein